MDLIEILKLLNRKERDYLVKSAFKLEENRLNEQFKKEIEGETGLKLPQGNMYIAVDYHLDWLAIGIYLFRQGYKLDNGLKDGNNNEIKTINNNVLGGLSKEKALHTGTQADSDLLIVFKNEDNKYVVICIEAKCDTSWDFDQLGYKLKRLGSIKKFIDTNKIAVELYFIMYSPFELVDLKGLVFKANINRKKHNMKNNKRRPMIKLINDFDCATDSIGKKRPYWIKMTVGKVLYNPIRKDKYDRLDSYRLISFDRKEFN